jgi:hypothetical protein
MFSFVLPLLLVLLTWIIGRPIIGAAQEGRPSEGHAVFVGLAVVVAVLSFFTFVLQTGTRHALWVILPLAVLVAGFGRRHLRNVDYKEAALLAAVFLLVYVHFLWPLITHRGTEVALSFAGDYNQYVGMGTWLQDRSILDPVNWDLGFNPLHSNVIDHQGAKLRIGALLLLGFLSTIAGHDVAQVFSGYSALLLALQALAVVLLARRLAPDLPPWVAGLAGALFGLCPTATYATWASFLPQAMGLALIVTGVAALTMLVDSQVDQPAGWGRGLARCIPSGLLFFAAWSCYPEAVPLGVLVSLLYVIFARARGLLRKPVLRGILQSAVGVLGVWVLASPPNFWWGVQGMIVQLQGTPHGGEQHITPWTVVGTMVGAIEQPLFPHVGVLSGEWFNLVSLAACAALLAGIAFLLVRAGNRLALAATAAAVILVGFVLHRYSFARFGTLADWDALRTWNVFKAAIYLGPFAMPAGVVGVIALGRRLAPARGAQAAAVAISVALLVLAARQDVVAARRMSYVRIPGELRSFLAAIPPGRLLLDVHDSANEADYNQRYSMYGVLRYRPFMSVRDGQPAALHMHREPELREFRTRFLSEPFPYVLTDAPHRYAGAPVVGRSGPYSVLDVRKRDFVVTITEWGKPPETLLSLAATGKPRQARLQIFGAGETVMSYEIGNELHQIDLRGQDGAVVPLPVSASGGLSQLTFDPAPARRPEFLLWPAVGPAAPPVRIDLSPQLSDMVTSTDTQGQRMALAKGDGIVHLTMARAGTSRAQLAARLPPGEYLLHVRTGNVTIAHRTATGLGAYVGPDNDRERSVELKPDGDVYTRVAVRGTSTTYFALGFGGWGSASGSADIKTIELIPASGNY